MAEGSGVGIRTNTGIEVAVGTAGSWVGVGPGVALVPNVEVGSGSGF